MGTVMITYTEDEFGYTMAEAAKSRGRKQLFCGEAVLAWLKESFELAIPFAMLTGIDIIALDSYAPTEFRIIRHDSCIVANNDVTHGRCSVIADGFLAL
jgi:hypothetical protein